MDHTVKEFKTRLNIIEEGLESDMLAYEQALLDLEHDIYNASGMFEEERLVTALKKILKQIKKLKAEYDFYDEETERGYLFPNGEDDE